IDTQGHDLTFDTSRIIYAFGAISGAGGIVKTGAGPLALYGDNTYTGPTAPLEGYTQTASGTGLGGSGAGTILAGGVLGLGGCGREAVSSWAARERSTSHSSSDRRVACSPTTPPCSSPGRSNWPAEPSSVAAVPRSPAPSR